MFGFYLGNLKTVVLTDYEDIKEVFNMDETAHRPSQAPGHKIRPGWAGPAEMDPELNRGRTPGVIGSNVSKQISIK